MRNNADEHDKKGYRDIFRLCLILDYSFTFMMYGVTYNLFKNPNIAFAVAALLICIIKPISGIIMYFVSNFLKQKSTLYFGISSIIYSLMFLWMFYIKLYKNASRYNLFFLILGIVGYMLLVSIILFYRYNVYIGSCKDKSGVPKYSIIGAITVLGGILIGELIDKQSEDIQNIVMVLGTLIISYTFSFGYAQLFKYWVSYKVENLL